MTPVEEIKERLNIVEIVQEYVPLKRAGTNHKARCPFHNEKTPSFSVSESKQFFHCFGCGKSGDIFTFIQEMEAVEFAEALRMLAKKAGVELHFTQPREHNERTKLLDCLHAAANFYHDQLRTPEGQNAAQYLAQRGVLPETIAQFQIGYSPESWDAVIQHLKKKGFSDKQIERSGLSVRSEKTGGSYDRFRGRLIFPIHNHYGNVIGFGGRTLDPNQKEAKYINSPQTEIYNKSAVLYGLHLAKKFIQKVDAAVVVEGYMDVVAAHQAKFRNVVAASGTALTPDQVRLLKRFSQNAILSFDADSAGQSAAWRGMQVAIQEGMNVKVLVLPKGRDPDDVIRADPQEFRACAAQAKPFLDHAFAVTTAPLDMQNAYHKKKTAGELLPLIALLPDPIERTHYTQLLARTLDVPFEVLKEKINSAKWATTANARPKNTTTNRQLSTPQRTKQLSSAATRADALAERLLALIVQLPGDFSIVQEKLKNTPLPEGDASRLYNILESQYNHTGKLDTITISIDDQQLADQWRKIQLIGEEHYGSLSPQERQQELLNVLESLERYRVKLRLRDIEHCLSTAEQQNDSQAITELSKEFRVLTDLLRKLT